MAQAMAEAMDPDREEREAWLAERRKGLGGTDAAAILGFSKWATPLSVWLDKRGEAPPDQGDEGKEWLWWGRQLEDLIARRYMERTGKLVHNPRRIFHHAEFPYLLGTPDRLVIDEPRGIDIKTARRGDEWGPPGSDDIPMVYVAQMHHYMAVTGYPVWDVAVLISGSDFRIYTLHRDEDVERDMVEQLSAWWERHIVQGVRPAIDGSDSTTRWLRSRYPAHFGEVEPAPSECAPLVEQLASARIEVNEWEERKSALENEIKLLIEGRAGFQGNGWRVTWKKAKDGKETDWEKTARSLAERIATAELLNPLAANYVLRTEAEKFTQKKPGSRRFLLTLQDRNK